MLGQEGKFGTGIFEVVLDTRLVNTFDERKLNKKRDLDDMFGVVDKTQPCSIANIEIEDAIDVIQGENTGEVPDDYDLGF